MPRVTQLYEPTYETHGSRNFDLIVCLYNNEFQQLSMSDMINPDPQHDHKIYVDGTPAALEYHPSGIYYRKRNMKEFAPERYLWVPDLSLLPLRFLRDNTEYYAHLIEQIVKEYIRYA